MDNSLGLRPKAGFFARVGEEREGVGGGKVDAPGVEVFMGNTYFMVHGNTHARPLGTMQMPLDPLT